MNTHTIDLPAPIPAPDEVRNAPLPFDLFREVHKGLRLALFDLTVTAGRTDGADVEDRAALVSRARSVIELLHLHHHHEDASIEPMIVATAPELAEGIAVGHLEVDADLCQLGVLLGALESSDGTAGVAAVHSIYRFVAAFTARYLQHMELEEGAVMQALRSSISLDQLFGVEVGIRSSVAPPVMVEFMGVMLPAMTPDERTAMLGGMRAGAPAEIFELFRVAAQRILSPTDYAVVASRIGVA